MTKAVVICPGRGTYNKAELGYLGRHFPDAALLDQFDRRRAERGEETLRDLGVAEVTIAAKVSTALKALEETEFDFAVLDFNLGTESSEPVAKKLVEIGVPFWLATGYGEMADRLEEIGARGVLTKPYGKDELRRMLGKFAELDRG